MPVQSVLMFKISLVYLLTAVILGGLLLVNKTAHFHPAIWSLMPVHYEMAFWGWMAQFVLATAYWISPKFLTDSPRGSVPAAWVMAGSYNIGVIILLAGSLLRPGFNYRMLAGVFIILSVFLFAGLIWRRIVSNRDR